MADISPLLAAITLIVWPLFTSFCTYKYLRAFKLKKRLDTWIWFVSWCLCISVIEWWVLSAMIVIDSIW